MDRRLPDLHGRYDPQTQGWDLVQAQGLGIQEDAEGRMWLGAYGQNGVYSIDAETLQVLDYIALPTTGQSKGVAVDFFGYVWVVSDAGTTPSSAVMVRIRFVIMFSAGLCSMDDPDGPQNYVRVGFERGALGIIRHVFVARPESVETTQMYLDANLVMKGDPYGPNSTALRGSRSVSAVGSLLAFLGQL